MSTMTELARSIANVELAKAAGMLGNGDMDAAPSPGLSSGATGSPATGAATVKAQVPGANRTSGADSLTRESSP